MTALSVENVIADELTNNLCTDLLGGFFRFGRGGLLIIKMNCFTQSTSFVSFLSLYNSKCLKCKRGDLKLRHVCEVKKMKHRVGDEWWWWGVLEDRGEDCDSPSPSTNSSCHFISPSSCLVVTSGCVVVK